MWGDTLLRNLCRSLNVTLDEVRGRNRSFTIARKRQIAMYLMREMTKASYRRIGSSFDRHNTTVLYACQEIGRLRRDEYQALINRLLAEHGRDDG